MIRFKRMYKLLPLVLALTLVLALVPKVSPVQAAQDNQLEMKNLDLQVWPEYDDKRVLAIFNGTLTNTSNKDFNGNVYFNVPKDIEVKMACELVNGTEHSCQPYELENKGDYQVLRWKTTHSIAPGQDYPIWLEYYYNPLKGYPDKTMSLDYTPYYKTQSLKVTIKEPLKSSNFKIEPAPSSSNQDGEGFKNDFFNFQNLDSNKLVSLKIFYTRSEKEPSVKPQNQDNNQQAAASDPLGTSAWKKPEVLIPVVLFVIVLIIFIFYSFNSSRNAPPTDRIRRIQNKYGNSGNKGSHKSSSKAAEKKRIRQMLLDGIQMEGSLVKGSTTWDPGTVTLKFDLTDGQNKINISYNGVKPDNFDSGYPIIVEGRFDANSTFIAENVKVRCPSKYEAETKNQPSQ